MSDHRALVNGITQLYPTFGDWEFEYEYPGYFVYHRMVAKISVYFTPDHTQKNVIDIMAADGEQLEYGEVPFTVRTAENLFQAVRPWLEKYGKITNPKLWRPRKKK